jgi:hypothetical protein
MVCQANYELEAGSCTCPETFLSNENTCETYAKLPVFKHLLEEINQDIITAQQPK